MSENGVVLTSIKSLGKEENTNGTNESHLHAKRKFGASGEPPSITSDEVDEKDENDKRIKEDKMKEYSDDEKLNLSYFQLFRYATCSEILIILIGSISAIAVGCGTPINFVIFGDVINDFLKFGAAEYANRLNASLPTSGIDPLASQRNVTIKLFSNIFNTTKWFLILASVFMIVAMIQILCWQLTSMRQTRRFRLLLYQSILRQEIAWHDKHSTGDLVTRLSDQVNTIENGIGEKAAVFLQYFSTFVFGIILGLVRSWKLALVTFSLSPLLGLTLLSMGFIMKKMVNRQFTAYGKAGTIAEEVLHGIRTVVAFGGEEKEMKRYQHNLQYAAKVGIRKGLFVGLAQGSIGGMIYVMAGLSFWYGAEAIIVDGISPGVVVQVFFCGLIGGFSLGNAVQSIDDFWNAVGAANNTFSIIQRKSKIDVNDGGIKPETFEGRIEFKNVEFAYESRPDFQVLNGFSFYAAPGETVALVGESGSGKSTVIQLLQRFYDKDAGEILIDGRPLTSLDLTWFRKHVGVVQQEPVLFAGSIAENIRFGRMDATDEEIKEAARMANAHDFIERLPEGYATTIGEGGGTLSGGQKQRVAIARALVRRPRILLLDEATSALDNHSESLVQAALDSAVAGHDCTVVMIAHRLTTVRNADRIIVMRNGRLVEEGNHTELMTKIGEYYRLVTKKYNKAVEENVRRLSRVRKISISEAELLIQRTKEASDAVDIPEVEVVDGTQPDKSETKEIQSVEDIEVEGPPLNKSAMMCRTMALNRPEVCYVIMGVLCATVVGAVMPCFSILFSEMLRVYTMFIQPAKMRSEVMLYSGLLGAVAVINFFLHTIKNFVFGVSGERLTMRIRLLAFKAILKQEIGWFDLKENHPGTLTAQLAADASFIQGVTGIRFGIIAESAVIMSTSIIIAFIFGWKLTLVILAFIPLLTVVGMIHGRRMKERGKGKNGKVLDSSRTTQEAIGNIKTVMSLNLEEYFHKKYADASAEDARLALRQALFFGFFNGLSYACLYCAYAAVFTYGAKLIDDGEMEFYNVFRVFTAVTFGSQMLGRNSAFAPDMKKAMNAAQRIYGLLDRQPQIDTTSSDGQVPSEPCSGIVQLKDVEFSYPTRRDVKVLDQLSVIAQPGETVALVGESGCGKSTVMQLLMRFYDISGGSICIDNMELSDLRIKWLRSQIGLVSQEPVLFNLSIRDNIAYGDNEREVPMADIIKSAREANIHDFIATLPEGYDTKVGQRGGQMSGGQKQRIAIARALVRQPAILLLDEATSALDSDSERVVQEALDRAREGRTCIVIAHRLSTIEKADRIAVIHDGRVVEIGTHSQLMREKGDYFKIHNAANI